MTLERFPIIQIISNFGRSSLILTDHAARVRKFIHKKELNYLGASSDEEFDLIAIQ